MSNDELLDKIFSVETVAGMAAAEVNRLREIIDTMNQTHRCMIDEIEQLKDAVGKAAPVIIHEMKEYLIHNDIQDLDENDFTDRLHSLIFAPVEYALPF